VKVAVEYRRDGGEGRRGIQQGRFEFEKPLEVEASSSFFSQPKQLKKLQNSPKKHRNSFKNCQKMLIFIRGNHKK
jgi:hypothetical protein